MVVGTEMNTATTHLGLPGSKQGVNATHWPPTPVSSVSGSEFSSTGSSSSYTSNESNGNTAKILGQQNNRLSYIHSSSPKKLNSSFMNVNSGVSVEGKGAGFEQPKQGYVGQGDQNQVFSPYQYNQMYESPISSTSSGSGSSENRMSFPTPSGAGPMLNNQKQHYRQEETDSDSYTSGDTDSDDVSDSDDESDSDASDESSAYGPTQHPYYREWQQYYAAMYAHQQYYQRQSMYSGGGLSMMQPMYPGNYQNMALPYLFNPYMNYQQMAQAPVEGNPNNLNAASLITQMQNMMLSMNGNMLSSPANQMQSSVDPNVSAQFYQMNQLDTEKLAHQQTVPQETHPDSILMNEDTTIQLGDETNGLQEYAGSAGDNGVVDQSAHEHHNETLNVLNAEKSRKPSDLLAKSRKSTIKSNRFPSVPSSTIESEKANVENAQARRQSLENNFKPGEFKKYSSGENSDSEYEEDTKIIDSDRSSKDNLNTSMATNERELENNISRECESDTKLANSQNHGEPTDKHRCNEASIDSQSKDRIDKKPNKVLKTLMKEEDDKKRYISDYGKFLFEDNESEGFSQPTKKPICEDSLERSKSNASSASYNSIQSEGSSKFTVISAPSKQAKIHGVSEESQETTERHINEPISEHRHEKHERKQKHRKSRRKSKKNTQKTAQAPPLMLSPPLPPLPPKTFMQSPASHRLSHMSSGPSFSPVTPQSANINYPVNDSMSDLRRLSYASPEASAHPSPRGGATAMRQSLPPMLTPQQHIQAPPDIQAPPNIQAPPSIQKPQQPKLSDKLLNKKCEEFVNLRQVIASGNKSVEYRLKWIKMLIIATNYKLYSYINIKGEPIPPEETSRNKSLFIKSSINHLTKLLKECEEKKRSDDIRMQVFYIYACMLMNDHVRVFSQDFGIKKDIPKAISYFEKSLNINPTEHRSLYKIGEIYELEYADQLDRALKYYKLSAKTGYYSAIYKVSLLHLNVPKMRTTKFYNYLYDLANINFEDVALEGEDMEELEDVVGMSCYQLGRIHEGVYPGDLNPNDEFIVKSLEIAPINYAKSLGYYNKAARLRCLVAAVKLGTVYEKAELTRNRNPNKSIQWYLKASTSPLPFKRHPEAMLGLSRWYLCGSQNTCKYIPAPDPAKAIFWCERAIKDFDYPAAYYQMGELCKMGLVNSDPMLWYQKAQQPSLMGPSV